MPTRATKFVHVAEVASLVSPDLFSPPRTARFWQAVMGAVLVSVPEAAVDEDDGVLFRHYDVGPYAE